MSDRCAICGLEEYEHHDFVRWKCSCEPGEWNDLTKVPPPCAKYDGNGGNCLTCEHDEACHAKEAERE